MPLAAWVAKLFFQFVGPPLLHQAFQFRPGRLEHMAHKRLLARSGCQPLSAENLRSYARQSSKCAA